MESKTRDRVSGGFSLPGYVLKVLGLLEASGNEAYVAGGAVRDMLLDLTPHDFDIASSSSPEITAKVLSDAGIRFIDNASVHGTVTAVMPEGNIEITTFRASRKALYDGIRALLLTADGDKTAERSENHALH